VNVEESFKRVMLWKLRTMIISLWVQALPCEYER
jgi:hypothetical protein